MTPQNTILIVDDENRLRLSLSLILQKENYRVETVANAEDALDCLQQHEYDLMFLGKGGYGNFAFVVDSLKAMLNAIFHQRLQQEVGDQGIERIRIDLHGDLEARPQPRLLNL